MVRREGRGEGRVRVVWWVDIFFFFREVWKFGGWGGGGRG